MKIVNVADRCKDLDSEMIEKARRNMVPEELIKLMTQIIKGWEHSAKRLPAALRGPMGVKKEAGWENFLRGWILRLLGEFQWEEKDIEMLCPYI